MNYEINDIYGNDNTARDANENSVPSALETVSAEFKPANVFRQIRCYTLHI